MSRASTRTDVSKVTANLPDADIERLTKIAERHASTKTTALVRAIRAIDFLEEAEAKGGKIFIEDADGSKRQVVFK
jgi:predicted transcriptional regulator